MILFNTRMPSPVLLPGYMARMPDMRRD